MIMTAAGAAEGIFWFGLLGASIAPLKHLAIPVQVVQELTPVGLEKKKDKDTVRIHPGVRFWAIDAFAAMNIGFASVGIWGAYTASPETKQAFLLGTGVLFECFATAWFLHGKDTGKKDFTKQGVKIACLGCVFLTGFALMLAQQS